MPELSCSIDVIDGWDVPTRAAWFAGLRARLDAEVAPGAGAVFQNIQDVLELSVVKGFDEHPWFLAVDAAIIEAIQAGFALTVGGATSSANPAAAPWQRFLEAFRDGRPAHRLDRLWGTAEQLATNHGMQRARDAGIELGRAGTDDRIRFALIEVGNTYRQNLAWPTTASERAFRRVCEAPSNLLEAVTGFLLRLATAICDDVEGFFSVQAPSAILALGGVAYDAAPLLRPLAHEMGLFEYHQRGPWAPTVALP